CYAAGTLLLCHFGPSHPLTRTENSPKSNHSRTSKKFSRKFNYSRTYAKTGGWGSKNVISNRRPAIRKQEECSSLSRLLWLATRHSLLSTDSNHSRTFGNCYPTSRTSSNIYHYIKYPLSARRQFCSGPSRNTFRDANSAPPRPGRGKRQDGPSTRRRNPRAQALQVS